MRRTVWWCPGTIQANPIIRDLGRVSSPFPSGETPAPQAGSRLQLLQLPLRTGLCGWPGRSAGPGPLAAGRRGGVVPLAGRAAPQQADLPGCRVDRLPVYGVGRAHQRVEQGRPGRGFRTAVGEHHRVLDHDPQRHRAVRPDEVLRRAVEVYRYPDGADPVVEVAEHRDAVDHQAGKISGAARVEHSVAAARADRQDHSGGDRGAWRGPDPGGDCRAGRARQHRLGALPPDSTGEEGRHRARAVAAAQYPPHVLRPASSAALRTRCHGYSFGFPWPGWFGTKPPSP